MRQRRVLTEEVADNAEAQIVRLAAPERRESVFSEKVRRLRLWRRQQVSVVARAVIGGRSLPLTIGDVSQTGLGFRGQTGLVVDTAVEIHLSDGRVLDGTVVWTRNGRGGIQLAEPLGGDDPVFGTLLGGAVSGGQSAEMNVVGQGAQNVVEDVWRRITGLMVGQGVAAELSARSIERACRKQGFSWLADEELNAGSGSNGSAGIDAARAPENGRPK